MLRIVGREEDYPPSIIKPEIALHNILWMYPFVMLPYSGKFIFSRGGECRYGCSVPRRTNEIYSCMVFAVYFSPLESRDLMVAAHLVFSEVAFSWVWGFPDFPEAHYSIFLGLVVGFFSWRFIASVPSSLVPSFAHIWSSSNAAYDRVRS